MNTSVRRELRRLNWQLTRSENNSEENFAIFVKLDSMNNKIIYVILFLAMMGVICDVGLCRGSLGGKRNANQNGGDIDSIGRFAVQQHNDNQNTLLEFVRVVKAEKQVVAGMIYYLTLEVMVSGQKKLYEAKVWVKPWMNFKQLQEFKPANGNPSVY